MYYDIKPCNVCKKNDVCKILEHLQQTPTTLNRDNVFTPPKIEITFCKNKIIPKCENCDLDATENLMLKNKEIIYLCKKCYNLY